MTTDDATGPVVVGFDGSETATRAVHAAAALAQALDSSLHIVSAISRSGATRTAPGDPWTIGGVDNAEQLLANLAGEVGVAATTAVSFDDPATALIDEANRIDASCIVVGNRRVKGMARILGSVAGDVVRNTNRAVHIVPTT